VGFSVSGSAAIVFAGMFIAFGLFHAAASDSFERVSEARQAESDADLDQQNTAIVVSSASYDNGTDQITVEVENTGASTLSLNGTDILVDNEYITGWQSGATIGTNAETDLWLPAETVTVTLSQTTRPEQVKVVTAHGVADTEVFD